MLTTFSQGGLKVEAAVVHLFWSRCTTTPHKDSSYPAHAGYPVRRSFSILSLMTLEYWITRRSLSSGGRSADPLAGDDGSGYGAIIVRRRNSAIPRRDAPEVCMYFRAMRNRGRGECRAHDAPAASRAVKKHTSVVTTGPPKSPGIPCAMVLTVSFALSPVTNSFCHRHRRIKVFPDPVGPAKPPPI